MLAQIITENGQKKIIPLTADAGAGNPVGTIIVVCSNQIPSNYLPLGTQFDTSLYPVLYALLGTDTTPTASALGLPTLTSGQYAIKATSGLSENAQDNVVAQLNEERSYSTEEVNTGAKWIDGKPIYRRVKTDRLSVSANGETALITVSNSESIVRMEGFSYTTNGSANIPFNCLNGRLYYRTSDKTIMFNSTISRENVAYTLILEYTKTTD